MIRGRNLVWALDKSLIMADSTFIFLCLFLRVSSLPSYDSRDICNSERSILRCVGEGPGRYLIRGDEERLVLDGNFHNAIIDLTSASNINSVKSRDAVLSCESFVFHHKAVTLYVQNQGQLCNEINEATLSPESSNQKVQMTPPSSINPSTTEPSKGFSDSSLPSYDSRDICNSEGPILRCVGKGKGRYLIRGDEERLVLCGNFRNALIDLTSAGNIDSVISRDAELSCDSFVLHHKAVTLYVSNRGHSLLCYEMDESTPSLASPKQAILSTSTHPTNPSATGTRELSIGNYAKGPNEPGKSVEDRLVQLEDRIKELEEVVRVQKQTIEISRDNRANGVPDTQHVAFHAQLSQNLNNLTEGTPIVFDDVFLNEGYCYDTHHGVFTAYQRGIYFFMAKFSSDLSARIWIVKGNGTNVCYDHSFLTAQAWESRVAMATMLLNVGDRVWVEGFGTIRGYASYGPCYTGYRKCYHTGFTGHLVSSF